MHSFLRVFSFHYGPRYAMQSMLYLGVAVMLGVVLSHPASAAINLKLSTEKDYNGYLEKYERALNRSDYPNVISYLDSALGVCQNCTDSVKAYLHERLGIYLQYVTINAEGVFHLDTANRLMQKHAWVPDFNVQLMISYAEVLRANQQFQLALDEINRAHEYSKIHELSAVRQARLYSRMVAIHQAVELGVDTIIKNLETAQKLSREIGDSIGVAMLYRELANIQGGLGNVPLALSLNMRAQYLYESIDDPRGVAEVLINIGNLYITLENYAAMEEIGQRMVELSIKYRFQETLAWGYSFLVKANQGLGRYKRATELYQKRDSVDQLYFSINWRERIGQFYSSLEEEAKRQSLAAAKLKREAVEAKLMSAQAERKLNRSVSFFIAVLLILVSFFLIQMRRNLKKEKKQSSEKEFLLREVHHRVKNNLQSLAGLLSLQMEYSKNPEHIRLLQDVFGRVNAIALTHSMLSNNENVDRVKMPLYLKELIEELKATQGDPMGESTVHIDDVDLSFDKAVCVGMIVNELITNTIKHGNFSSAQGFNLTVSNKKDYCEFNYSNGGKVTGTNESGNGGLGLKLIDIAAKRLGAFNIQQGEDFSYTIQFRTP